MARTWLSIRVDLVEGAHAHDLWPRPGRILLARPGMTFRMLADAINTAFARWDHSHLHAFTLADGTRISVRTPWDEFDDDALDDTVTTLSRLRLGDRFVFEFDFGDSWMHLCTVGERKVDPYEVYGEPPDRPAPYFGWGDLPDQYGRRWDGDDGASPVPDPPDPLLSDLPDLHPGWGSQARTRMSAPPQPGADPVRATVVEGPWQLGDGLSPWGAAEPEPWSAETVARLRGAVARRDAASVVDLVARRDPLTVAHLAAPGLFLAVADGQHAARWLLDRLLPVLHVRGWLGDVDLAHEIGRVLGDEVDGLRPTPADLDELASALDGPTTFDDMVRLEIASGQLWSSDPEGMAGINEPDDFDDPDRFVMVAALGSGPGYGDMRDFIATVTDEALAARLEGAIRGKGAFRRFRDLLYADGFWWDVWSTFRDERRLARARWWLAEAGLRPATAFDEPTRETGPSS